MAALLRSLVAFLGLVLSIYASGAGFVPALAQGQGGQFSAAASAIAYLGRVQRGESVLWTWPGSGLRVGFSNSRSAQLALQADSFGEYSSENTSRLVWYRIDGGPWLGFSVAANTGGTFPLAVPADRGAHTLEVVKASEGRLTFRGILLEPGGKLFKTPLPARRIEIVGDSISAGFRLNGPGNFESPGHHDARGSYGWILGERLKADVRLIAVTTRGLVHNYGTPPEFSKPLPAYYPFLHREGTLANDWSWQPDLIVLNLGTNDITLPGETPGPVFQDAYLRFLAQLRNANPRALILAVQPFGALDGTYAIYPNEIRAAVEARRRTGDSRVWYVSTTGWLKNGDFTDGTHPNGAGHLRAAENLLIVVKSLTGW